jgi:signal transduction histidine kinase
MARGDAVSSEDPGTEHLAALDLLPEAVVVCDRDGVVRHLNARTDRVLGIGAAALGRPLSDVLVLRDDTGRRCRLPPSSPTVASRLAERILHVEDAEGNLRPVALAGRFDDRSDGWVLTVRPAGRREALARVQGDVLATISHEIRAPLASVKGFSRTLLRRWDRFSDDQKLAMLATIDADADRVARLLTDLLEVSRIDAGRVRLRREPTDLVALVGSVIEAARKREDAAGRELSMQVGDGALSVVADADRLGQAVGNLVDNALRHAPDGPIEVTLAHDGDGVRISVSDAGPGVDPDLAPTIFAKFARGRRDRSSGTGLGLYLARGLVRAHGGRIWAEQPAGGGAVFHVWLPSS